jgi:DNA-binding NarL/FixJ family response regulator
MKKEDAESTPVVGVVSASRLWRDALAVGLHDRRGVEVAFAAEGLHEARRLIRKGGAATVLWCLDGAGVTPEQLDGWPERHPLLLLADRVEQDHWSVMAHPRVRGYVLHDMALDALADAIGRVCRGERVFRSGLQAMPARSAKRGKGKQATVVPPEFTQRELEILRLVVGGLTSREIGNRLDLSSHTIESHRKNLLVKSGQRNVVQLVRYALRNGLAE